MSGSAASCLLMDLRDADHTQTIWADKESARRISARMLSKDWWFAHEVDHGTSDGLRHRFTFSVGVHLEKDLRRALPNLRFTVR